MQNPQRPCFFAERPLGRLAKWLRLLGFDTLYEPDVPKASIKALASGRIHLTRRRQPFTPVTMERIVWIRSDHVQAQLRQVLLELGLKKAHIQPFSRCTRCNAVIEKIDKTEALGHVPDHVWETQEVFSTCRACGRLYWPGTHTERARKRIRALFSET